MSRARRRRSSAWVHYTVFGFLIPLAILIAFLPSGPGRPVLIIYGDSLTVQSQHDAHQIGGEPRYRVVFRAAGGTALCDVLQQAAKDRQTLLPQRIVIAFTGNTATCAQAAYRRGGAAATIALYEKSLRRMRAIYPTLPITVVIPPAMRDQIGWYPLNGDPRLVAMYKRVGAELHMYVNTDADTWLTPGHVFEQDRPDFVTGKMVDVRLSDGVHLSPAGEQWYGAALLEKQTGDVARSKAKSRIAAG